MKLARLATIALVASLAAGCTSAPPLPADRYYPLEVPLPAAGPPLDVVIGVDPVRAGGIYSERALLFLRDGALEQRRFDFWAQAPDLMIEQALLAHLRVAFGAEQVVTAGARVHADFTVRTRIQRLEQLAAGNGARQAVVLEFAVADSSGRTVAVLQSGGERDLASPTPAGFVHGVEAQCHDSFGELAAKLRELAPHS